MRVTRRLAGWGVVLALLAATGCGEEPQAPGAVSEPEVLASAPVPRTLLGQASDETVAYVSAPAGTVARARRAVVTNRRTGAGMDAVVVAGGFDPVAIAAADGDVLEVTLTDSAGEATTTTLLAKRGTKPRVVRTAPAPRATDVPLNTRVLVIFTAPMDEETVRAGLQLFAAAGVVPGSVALRADGLAAEFAPDAPLAPSTEHELRITGPARDVLGQELEDEVRVPFSTAEAGDPVGTGPATLHVYPVRHSEPSWHDPASRRDWRPRALFPGDTLWLRVTHRPGTWDSLAASWQSIMPGVVRVQLMPGGREAFVVAIAPGTAEVRATVTSTSSIDDTDRIGALRLQVFEPMPASMLAGVRIDIVRQASLAFRQEVDGAGATQLGDAASLASESVWWDEYYTGYGMYRAWRYASVRPDGRLAVSDRNAVSVTDTLGGPLRVLLNLGFLAGCPVWSPDGRYVAITGMDGRPSDVLWVVNAATGQWTERMATGTIPTCPQWSPDGTRFFITAQELGGYQVYAFWLEGDDPGEPLFLHQVAGPVAPDGRTLLVGDTHGNLYRAGIDGRQHQFIAAVGRVSPVAWSADGSLIAMPFYIMSADGRYAHNVDGEILGFAP